MSLRLFLVLAPLDPVNREPLPPGREARATFFPCRRLLLDDYFNNTNVP